MKRILVPMSRHHRAMMLPQRDMSGSTAAYNIQSSRLWKENSYYLNGEWISSNEEKTFDVLDPSTEQVIAQVPDIPEKTSTAIAIAHDAGKEWRNSLAKERSQLLHKIYQLHQEYEEDLASIISYESGKPLSEAVAEVRYGASYFQWFASLHDDEGSMLPSPVPGRTVLSTYEPVGVCGLISPWNFPHAMMARKVAPALRAGCTSVLKPSEETPLTVLALCEILHQAGVPAGVVNCITSADGQAVGGALTSAEEVRKISFTGSTAVGQWLTRESAATMKKISMELGGNAPFIITENADLDAALEGLLVSKFRNAGQTCVATNRVFCHASIYDEFAKRLAQRVAQLQVGRFDVDGGVDMGPLIHRKSVQRVDALVQDALNDGAEALVGGSADGCFYKPTVLVNVTDSMRVAKEEIFGPVCPLLKFSTDDEVITRANDTDAGLAAYFYTSSPGMGRILHFQNQLEYGMIGCNTGMISSEMTPFGGIKMSGYGREGSKYGLHEYQHVKTLALQHDV
mmetsp:Transcript_2135/g.3159  ORF Transcript_2135/g.3159 Transcript_2135/m.3159 type:complete len:513 (+) Transcript_2135:108-1646(+)